MTATGIRTGVGTLMCGALLLSASDWPTYRGTTQRNGVGAETLTFPLHARWSWRSAQAPCPAWPQPGKELHRIDFDYAFQPVIADGSVLFASSADHALRCVSLADGTTRWRFVSDSPLRFAPDIADGKAYSAGDDGMVHCLDLERGEVVWSFRCAPGKDMLLGNGHMMSRWPARTGVLVQDGTVYVTAGMWPAQGTHIYALRADNGEAIWHNDSSGSVYMRFPHPVASGFGGVAPQGYLLSSGNSLLVPTGRNIPAVFDRTTGELLHYKAAEALQDGGTRCTVWRDVVFAPVNRFTGVSEAHVGEAPPAGADGMAVYSLKTGEKLLRMTGRYHVLPAGDRLFAVGSGRIECLDVADWLPTEGELPDKVTWTQSCALPAYSIILTGNALLIGSDGAVHARSADTGEVLWEAKVDGQARGLAVADSHLVVSTDSGVLTCFMPGPPQRAPDTPKAPALAPKTASSTSRARDILVAADVRKGYALILGEQITALALAIARQSELHVIAIAPPGTNLQECRTELLPTGLYGTRLVVLGHPGAERLPLPPYFADLIVVGAGLPRLPAADICRVLRPCGGRLVCPEMTPQDLRAFARSAGLPELTLSPDGKSAVRGKLPGAGDWRYPWADAGRSGIGSEQRLTLPLDLLWFGGPGPDRMMDRHLATSPPLAVNGRAFVTGENHVIAFDAYTGRELWARPLKGAGRSYSRYYAANVVADDDSLYVAIQGQCTRLDQVTGAVKAVYEIPAEPMGEPVDPAVQPIAEKLPWAFPDRPHRVFLSCLSPETIRFPCVVQAAIDVAALLTSASTGEHAIASSVRVTQGKEDVPAEATLGAESTLRVRISLKEATDPTQRLCVYIATEGHFSAPSADAAKTSVASVLEGLVAAYDFETEGDTVADVSGNEHNGAAKGTAQVPGHTDNGISFDGREARILVKPEKALNPPRGLTAQAWVKLDRPDTGTILYKAYQYGLSVTKTDAGICFSSTTRSGDFLNVTSPSPIEFANWTHVAMTHDGGRQRLYINGELVADGQQGELTTSGNYLSLGASCYAPPKVYNHLACTIDDVRIYSRPLSQPEIQQGMQQEIPAVSVFGPTWIQHLGRRPSPIRDWDTRGWGYLSVAKGTVLGSYTAPVRDPQSAWAPRAESAALFALAKTDGETLWIQRPKQSISNNEIVHSDDTVFLVDATSNSTISLARRRGDAQESTQDLVALRLTDGKEVWRQSDVPTPGHRTHTPEDGPVFLFIAHRSQLQVAHGVVIVDGIAGYDAENGQKLWQRAGRLNKLAAIHGDTLIVPPYAYDLRTGRQRTDTDVLTGNESAWRFTKAYGCGAAIGCKDMLMFRSGSFGFLDLNTRGTTTFAGGKPSCNVSMIPANGLVIAAEGSSGCACSYNFQTSLALVPAERERDVWFAFPAVASRGNIRSLRLNFGAPGDRRDAQGAAWLGFPRPELGGVLPVSLAAQLSDAEYVYHPLQRKGTPHWLYHCGLRGNGRISIDLVANSSLLIQRTDTPPNVDGSDTDACWKQAKATPFLDTGRAALAPTVELKLLRDGTNLYAVCRRRSHTPKSVDIDAQDAFHLFITDATRKQAARFGIAPDGAPFEEGGPHAKRRNLEAAWNGAWQHSIVSNDSGWVAEFAIPLATLAELGLQLDRLALNAMARLQTRQGQQEIYLTDPIFRFAHCTRFVPVVEQPAPADERSFTVRLHFAEPPRFGVRVQGQDVSELATAAPTSGSGSAVVRELRGIRARDTLTIDLVPTRPGVVPLLNALEILEDQGAQP